MPAEWHLVVVDDEGVSVTDFDTPDELATHLKGLTSAAKAASVHVFKGARVPLSKRPFRYLMVPDGPAIPLFDPPTPDVADDNPVVGGDLAKLYEELTASLALLQDGVVVPQAEAETVPDDGAVNDDDEPL